MINYRLLPMRWILCVCLLMASVISSFAQPTKSMSADEGYNPIFDRHSVRLKVKNCPSPKAYLTQVYGGSQLLVDSQSAVEGVFHFKGNKPLMPGLYRVFFNEDVFLDIIINNEEVDLSVDANNMVGSMQVKTSRENRALYYYYQKIIPLDSALGMAYMMENREAADYLTDSLIRQKNLFARDLIRNFPFSFAAKLFEAYIIPEPSFYSLQEINTYKSRIEFLRQHFFDFINFGDSNLLYSEVFYTSINYYIEHLIKSKEEEGFIEACEFIMTKATKSKPVYDYVLNLLMEAFDQVRQDVVYSYLSEKYYLGESCTDTVKARSVREKVNILRKTALGEPAPYLGFYDMTDNLRALEDVNAGHVVVFFWATWCHHCEKSMPEMKKMYKRFRDQGVEVYAVCLDSSANDWKEAIAYQGLPWINVRAPRGFADFDVKNYNVWGTPKFFILNKDKRIIAKPANVAQIVDVLETRLRK